MYWYKNRLLPLVFNNFFTEVSEVHQYNTRSAAKQSYDLPKARTNYGKFNIRFQAPMIWNAIKKEQYCLPLVACFLIILVFFTYVCDTRGRQQLLETRLSRVKKAVIKVNDFIVFMSKRKTGTWRTTKDYRSAVVTWLP